MKIGLIGCGKQATKHIGGLVAAGAEPVLADLDPSLAAALGAEHGLSAVAHPDELFADADIAGIDICTPTPSHAPLISAAVAAGKAFFVEKPLAATLSEAQAIQQASVDAGVPGMVGYVYRFAPAFEIGHRFIAADGSNQSGPIGDITTAFFRIGGKGSHQPWKHQRATGGGAVNEMLVHMLDLMVWYFGRITRVDLVRCDQLLAERTIGGVAVPCDTEDIVVASFDTASGVQVLCQADMVSRSFLQFVDVQGTNGSFFGSISPQMNSFVHLDAAAADWTAGRTDLSLDPVDLYLAQMGEFVALCNDPTFPVRNPLADSVHLLEVVEMIRAEMETQ